MSPEGFDYDLLVPIIAIVGGVLVGAIAISFGIVSCMSKRKQFEQSRREIAAYVAEGSMTPDDAQKLLEARADADD